jgi:uncharacterized protein
VFFGAIGDIHADFDAVRRVMRRHAEIPFWLCVGDVGDDAGLYEDPPAPLHWIKGNNEDFDFLAGNRLANLHYIPNGLLVEIDGLRVAGVGGTHAPTWYEKKASELPAGGTRLQPRPETQTTLKGRTTTTLKGRTPTRRDDKRRHFVREEVEAVKMMRGLDVLLTHEAPRPFRAAGGHDAGKTPINEMVASAKPRLHLFGHHHRFVEMTVSGVPSVCLDLVSRSYLLIDRHTMEYERRETPTV